MTIPKGIVDLAKGCMLKFGKHPPLVFADGTKKKMYMEVPMGGTNPERCQNMMSAGISTAKQSDIGELEFVYHVCEAWASAPRKTYVRPSADPDRSEVLLITGLDVKANIQVLEMYTCIRDTKQAVLELKQVPTPGAEVQSDLLPSFVTGYRLYRQYLNGLK